MRLEYLYHWAPSGRYVNILAEGLRPGRDPNVASCVLPYVCLGTSPSTAWSLSGAMDWAAEIDQWDLWQARVVDGDDIRIRPDFLPTIREVKVYGPIPADRIWYAGTRVS